MREALAARSDDDFIAEKPARQPRRRKAAPAPEPAKPSLGKTVGAAALRHPAEILIALLLTGGGGYIAYNALVLQKARHPAPLFGRTITSTPIPTPVAKAPEPVAEATIPHIASEPAPLVSAPLPPTPIPSAPRSTARSPIGEMIRNGGEPPATPPSRPASVASAARPTERDSMTDMVRMGGPVPVPPMPVGTVEGNPAVMAAQRALAKLGYGVKIDGLAGPGTRQAIENFERDHRLTVTGELGARTTRELTALTGVSIQ